MRASRDREVTARGLRFHVREWGESSFSPVLVLHSIAGHSWEWDPLCEELADRFHAIAVDQRGHGVSEYAESYDPREMADDIGEIMVALGLKRASLVGHSMGALNSYLYAAEHPEAVERLVIVDVGPDTFTPESAAMLREALVYWGESMFDDPEDAFAEWREASPLATDDGLHRYVDHNLRKRGDGRWVWRFDAAGLPDFIEGLPPNEEQWDALRRIESPALIVRGAESDLFPRSGAERMVREMRNAELVEIPSAGHDVHIDQPDALVSAVRRFLDI